MHPKYRIAFVKAEGLYAYMQQFLTRCAGYVVGACFVLLGGVGMAQEATPVYTGKPLTLNFQSIEVRAALQIIADFTGLNVVASDSVTGSLSLRLHQVPWDQVLDIITQTKGLSQRRQGNVIWIATRNEIAARDKQELEMRQALQNLEPLITHNFILNYAKAVDVVQHIQGFGGLVGASQAAHGLGAMPSEMDSNAMLYLSSKHPFGQYHLSPRLHDGSAMGASQANMTQLTHGLGVGLSHMRSNQGRLLSARGSVMAEPRTNQLFVTEIASRVSEIQQIIAKIDIPLRQVMI